MSKNLKIKKSVAHVDKDGTPGATIITLHLDAETLLFSAELPDYVAKMGGAANVDTTIMADTANGVIETYEVRCDEYSRWRRAMNQPTRIWVGLLPTPGDWMTGVLGVSASCGIGFRRVKQDSQNRLFEVNDDGSMGPYIGPMGGHFEPILIDDTPENIAKIESLAGSIQVAANILADMKNAVDAQAYLMSIKPDFTLTVQPEQMELPLAVFEGGDDKAPWLLKDLPEKIAAEKITATTLSATDEDDEL